MPDIDFLLPHWIYWGGILAVPAFLMLVAHRHPGRTHASGPSLPLAYFFWAISGFMGVHRLYLRSWWAVAFIALFVGIILCNSEAKLTRNEHSIVRTEAFNASYDLEQAENEGAEDDVAAALRADMEAKSALEVELAEKLEGWHSRAGMLALVILALLVLDGFLLPRSVRRVAEQETGESGDAVLPPPDVSLAPVSADADPFTRFVSRVNSFAGEFAAYWTVIAVFVFYYEVVVRYIFNSPTVWVHESMFLLFGMQYLIAGGFCLRENAHVRVDVFYMHLSVRGRAIADLMTSFFFFAFTVALMVTGWIFFKDSFDIRQVSHTEWLIPYWPSKFALPLGGALIVTQGIVLLLKDIETLRRTSKG